MFGNFSKKRMQKHAYNSQVNTSVTTGKILLPTFTMSGEGPDALEQALVPAFEKVWSISSRHSKNQPSQVFWLASQGGDAVPDLFIEFFSCQDAFFCFGVIVASESSHNGTSFWSIVFAISDVCYHFVSSTVSWFSYRVRDWYKSRKNLNIF